MGLELSLDRLKALAKYAFGLGTLQMALCTLLFSLAALPVNHGIATQFLEQVAQAPASLVSIRTVDEAVVIGAALSMSSSAFVLQLLSERGEMTSKTGSATLGILLFQDIAVVPFLVLLPLLNAGLKGGNPISLLEQLAPTALQTVAGLGALLLGGRLGLRRLFEIVAQSRSSEAFVALSLLTVIGASLATSELGFSDTLGAFIAGVLLAETSYRTQVEADIRPFKGLLLGLFFATTGASINMTVLRDNWETAFWMLAGLLTIKTTVITSIGQLFGLTMAESIKTGFLLSQGGEFAFVLLSLASQLEILPESLNQLLIIVVVLSMAVTPVLASVGSRVATKVDDFIAKKPANTQELEEFTFGEKQQDPIVMLGFGPQAQMLVNMLDSPLAAVGGLRGSLKYIAFDLDPGRVSASREAGFRVIFGDGSRTAVLKAAGVEKPKAFVVSSASRTQSVKAVETVHQSFPNVPVYACALDLRHAAELTEAGSENVVIASKEAGMTIAEKLLTGLGSRREDVEYLRQGVEQALNLRMQQLASKLSSQVEDEEKVFVLDHQLQLAQMVAANGVKNEEPRPAHVPTAIVSMDGNDEEAAISLATVDARRRSVDKDDFGCDASDPDSPCFVEYVELGESEDEESSVKLADLADTLANGKAKQLAGRDLEGKPVATGNATNRVSTTDGKKKSALVEADA